MSTLTERVARKVFCAGVPAEASLRTAEAVIREVLAAVLVEPSEAMVRAYWNVRDTDPLEPEQTETLRRRLGPVLDAFARENEIEP